MATNRKKGKAAGKRKPAASKCNGCGQTQTVPRFDYFKADRPRCTACGGSLEYQGSWAGVRK